MSVTGREHRQHAAALSLAVVRAMLDDAAAHDYGPGHRDASAVLGIYADPSSIEPTRIEHGGDPVSVLPCVSALAVREALLARDPAGWLVVVTDRPEDDLGVGLLAHLVGHKLRTPDPWEAVRQQFHATGLEPALYADTSRRPLAHGLLVARPEQGWPPAPAGVLTREHALASVARQWLGVPRRSLDSLGVLQWTAEPRLAGRIADLRVLAGDELTDATLRWICASAGTVGPPLHHLLRRGEIRDAVPLGVVLGLLTGDDESTERQRVSEPALARLAHRWAGLSPEPRSLRALGVTATQVVSDLLRDRDRDRPDAARLLLARADSLLEEAGATELAGGSEVLPSGLTARLHTVAGHLLAATAHPPHGATEPDPQQVARHTASIEAAWAQVGHHVLGDPGTTGARDPRLRPVHGAVRLSRWLALPAPAADAGLASLALRQGTTDAWVDAAVNDTHEGVADPLIANALTSVLTAVERVRDRHDREFAHALAVATRDDAGSAEGHLAAGADRVWLLERLLAGVVVPLAKRTPTLLMVLDGMSTGVATEVVADVLARREGWEEALLPGATVRGTALAVLPSLTEVSRASLLSGELTTGGQDKEQAGHRALITAYALTSPTVFHKKPLDTSRAGFAVADDVALAIADEHQDLVTCVLNTIDDALDRSDPAGTTWTADAVKHLRPLLDRALAAGRTVVITADHGHVVERRQTTPRTTKDMSSNRSRGATPPPEDDEVLVTGRRVLKHGGTAVLPVGERLRYGPLKAGYHGGATPAEVVVPVIVLVPGEEVPEGTGLRLAPPQAPRWWHVAPGGEPATVRVEVPPTQSARPTRKPVKAEPGLFDADLVEPAVTRPQTQEMTLGAAVTTSEGYRHQRSVSGRIALSDEQVRAAVEALTAAPSTRLAGASLAGVLGVPATQVRGAVAQLQQLLNVESYPVLRTEGSTVILDEPLLHEQFGIR